MNIRLKSIEVMKMMSQIHMLTSYPSWDRSVKNKQSYG